MSNPWSSKVVSYFYDDEIGNFCYGGGNPMRPHRVRLTHTLVESYGLIDNLKVQRPVPQKLEEIAQFHADEYVDFLNSVTPDNQEEYLTQLRRFNLGPVGEADCPVFDGLFEYCQIYSGGSVNGAASLAAGEADICLNWSGGMHHAKKAEASGFCYINDIVLGILELLKTHQRVLYVDIDIHHGDGVEEAFYLTDRVMTVSFHKYGDFFPGTGAVGDIGYSEGKYYSLNVPLQEGMDDESYRNMFEPIMQKVMEMFQPGAVVVCAGADSLSGDRLGCFNLSLEGHSNCIEFLARFNVPMMVLGGGGYTMRNVARCWAYETGRLQGNDLPDKIPDSALTEFDYYMDTHTLRIATSNMKNGNTREQMEKIKEECLRNLAKLPPAPSAPITVRPPLAKRPELPEEDMDERGGGKAHREDRVNKFKHDAEEDTPEEGANKHRGGREYVEEPSAPISSDVKEEPALEQPPSDDSAPEPMEVDEAKPLDISAEVKYEDSGASAQEAGAAADVAMPDAAPATASGPPEHDEETEAPHRTDVDGEQADAAPEGAVGDGMGESAMAASEEGSKLKPVVDMAEVQEDEAEAKPIMAESEPPVEDQQETVASAGDAADSKSGLPPQADSAEAKEAAAPAAAADGTVHAGEVQTDQDTVGGGKNASAPPVEAAQEDPSTPAAPAEGDELTTPPAKGDGQFKVILRSVRDPPEKAAPSKDPAEQVPGAEPSSRSAAAAVDGAVEHSQAAEKEPSSSKAVTEPPSTAVADEDSTTKNGTASSAPSRPDGSSAEKKTKVKIVFNKL